MNKFFSLAIILTFLLTGKLVFANNNFYIGQMLQGKIELSFLTNIYLPQGEWTIIEANSSFENIIWKDITLLLINESKVQSILKIKYPKNSGDGRGWYKGRNNACDDFNGQKSNFHKNTSKKSVFQNNSDGPRTDAISQGYCISVWGSETLNLVEYKTEEYLRNQNIELTNDLVWIQQVYYSLQNEVTISYAGNAEFVNKPSSEFMNKAISLGQATVISNSEQFKETKLLDLSILSDLYIHIDSTNSDPSLDSGDIIVKLKKLKTMLDEGLISQEQYDTKSTKLLEDL